MAREMLVLKHMGLQYDESPRYKALNGQTDLVDLTIHKHDGKLRAPQEKKKSTPTCTWPQSR